MPQKYGKWNSVWRTFRRWCDSGMWDWMLKRLSEKYKNYSITLMVDTSHIKAHQDACRHPLSPDKQRLGKTKGGRNTKLSMVVNFAGMPLRFKLVCGNENDSISAIDTLHEHVDGNYVLADKAYDTNKIRDYIHAHAGIAEIPPKSNRVTKIEYDKTVGKLRHKVENCFARLKRFRRLNTRYDKLPQTFLGFVSLAVLTDWINFDFVHVP